MTSFSRRSALKLMGTVAASTGVGAAGKLRAADDAEQSSAACPWANTNDRVWLGGAYWANPMEDWCINAGGAECTSGGGNRNVHLLTHQITNPAGKFDMSVHVREVETGKQPSGVGLRIGIRSDINEYKSNSFAKAGIDCGLVGNKLVLGKARSNLKAQIPADGLTLLLQGKPLPQGGGYICTLSAFDSEQNEIGSVVSPVASDDLLGNVAIVSNFDANTGRQQGSRYRFEDWQASGDAFTVAPEHTFGPLLWSMYTLSDSRAGEGFVLKLTALTGPMGDDDTQSVELAYEQDGKWTADSVQLDSDAWTATFRVANWNEQVDTPFKLTYQEKHIDGTTTEHTRTGTIRANPAGRPLRLAALTCQNDYAFPYAPVAENLRKLDPDMLYFSGDQLYENHGGYGIIRKPADRAILNYLRKFYQHGWAFGEAMRDRPTVCIPDDHDVFQGNIWGEGGIRMGDGRADTTAGYAQPARMVNVVHRTCASHHPAPYDPRRALRILACISAS